MPHTPEERGPGTAVGGFGEDARVDVSLILAEFPLDILLVLAETLGNPLGLLVSKAHLSKSFRAAARTALAILERADLSDWYLTVDDAAVAAVASGCPQLSSLNLNSCRKITDEAVVALASGCKLLSSLSLNSCRKITDGSVEAVASGCPWLKDLGLHGCNKITDAAVAAVASGCPLLSSLDLGNCGKITDAAVVAVASGCKQLTSLNLDTISCAATSPTRRWWR